MATKTDSEREREKEGISLWMLSRAYQSKQNAIIPPTRKKYNYQCAEFTGWPTKAEISLAALIRLPCQFFFSISSDIQARSRGSHLPAGFSHRCGHQFFPLPSVFGNVTQCHSVSSCSLSAPPPDNF